MPNSSADSEKKAVTQLRIERPLLARVRECAKRKRMSANAYLCAAAEAAVERDEEAGKRV